MPYTPPLGNATNFDFTGIGGYTPPLGNVTNFDFGVIPPPSSAPSYRRFWMPEQFPDQEWLFMNKRKFGPAPVPLIRPWVQIFTC